MFVVYLAKTIQLLFTVYTLLLFVRIVGSWFPSFAYHPIMRFIAHYTDPYLNLFRRFIPPIGGVLDLSPILAYFGIVLLEKLLLFLLSLFL